MWVCPNCRSVNELRLSRCYRCDASPVEDELEVIDAHPTGPIRLPRSARPRSWSGRTPSPDRSPDRARRRGLGRGRDHGGAAGARDRAALPDLAAMTEVPRPLDDARPTADPGPGGPASRDGRPAVARPRTRRRRGPVADGPPRHARGGPHPLDTGSSSSAAGSPGCTRRGTFADDPEVAVTLLDRRNFHLFQPMLYQVATGALAPGRDRPAAALDPAPAAQHDGHPRRGRRHRPRQARGPGVRRRPDRLRHADRRDRRPPHVLRPRRVGAHAPGPQDPRGRDRDPAADPHRVRGRGTGGRPGTAAASG